jgi:hypothetical protein
MCLTARGERECGHRRTYVRPSVRILFFLPPHVHACICVGRCANRTSCSLVSAPTTFRALGTCDGIPSYLEVQFVCVPGESRVCSTSVSTGDRCWPDRCLVEGSVMRRVAASSSPSSCLDAIFARARDKFTCTVQQISPHQAAAPPFLHCLSVEP